VRIFFGQGERGSSDTDVRTFWPKKLKGGRASAGKGEEGSILCGRPLWTAPYEARKRNSLFIYKFENSLNATFCLYTVPPTLITGIRFMQPIIKTCIKLYSYKLLYINMQYYRFIFALTLTTLQ